MKQKTRDIKKLRKMKEELSTLYIEEFMKSPIWNTIHEIIYQEIIIPKWVFGIDVSWFKKILTNELALDINKQGYMDDLIKETKEKFIK